MVYVRAGGGPGGAGTTDDPYGTVAEAAAAAPESAVIALGKGTHAGEVVLPGGRALLGACVAETRLESAVATQAAGVVAVSGAGAEIRNLQLGGRRPGITAGSGADALVVEDVVIAGAEGVGWIVQGASGVTGRRVVIRDTQPRSTDLGTGRALEVHTGATFLLQGAVLSANRDIGVFASDATTVARLEDVAILDMLERASDLKRGRGVVAVQEARVELAGVVLERDRDVGLLADGAGTTIIGADVVVRDVRPRANDGGGGNAVVTQNGATVELARGLLERCREAGVWTAAATVRLEDVVVRETVPLPGGAFGHGVELAAVAQGDLTRVLVARNVLVGILVDDTGTVARLTDVVVRDTAAIADGTLGRGLNVQAGGAVLLGRGLFERNHEAAILVGGAGSSVDATDLVVRDTQSRPSPGDAGHGLVATAAGRVVASRVLLEGNREAGASAFDAGTTLVLSELVVTDTLERACASGGQCEGQGAGIAVGCYNGAAVEVTTFLLTRSALVGVQIRDAGVDLHGGEISWNPIGANIQTQGYDVARLSDNVRFVDNGANLDTQALTVPEPP